MTEPKDITIAPERVSSIPNDTSEVELGQWFWVKSRRYNSETKVQEDFEWLGCVMQIGSNFVEVSLPENSYSGRTERVHFDQFWERLRFEPEADAVIQKNIAHYRQKTAGLLEEVKSLTARLGISPQAALAHRSSAPGAENANALTVVTSTPDLEGYKNELILAKKETLPGLFNAMDESNRELARWMTAPSMPMKALIGPMKESIEKIDGAIFNISLYAGLTEDAVQCCDGEPAGFTEKLRVMQRRLYMDEECLLNYEAGGMTLRNVEDFDRWLVKPENRDRVLPFPRTVAAFRVRRFEREFSGGVGLLSAFIQMQMQQEDKVTFLYVRNGEQVWRIQTEMDFGVKLFPDAGSLEGKEMMVEMFGSRVKSFMPKREYEDRKAAHEAAMARHKEAFAAWRAENPDKHSIHGPSEPYSDIRYKDFEPFDPTSVYYDDASKKVNAQIAAYNRVGLIIQGLFDRSPVLHPHPPVQTWTPDGFARALELVYDGSGSALYAGEKPDFEAYRRRLNASIGVGSTVVGQEDFWLRHEAAKENRRINNGRGREMHYTRFRPYGDPGPGQVAQIAAIKPRAGEAVFRWTKRAGWRASKDTINRSVAVPFDRLLNIDAYTPGDYKQFFHDPRTREEYLRWAPLMLAAEDWHAGKAERLNAAEGGNTWAR